MIGGSHFLVLLKERNGQRFGTWTSPDLNLLVMLSGLSEDQRMRMTLQIDDA